VRVIDIEENIIAKIIACINTHTVSHKERKWRLDI